LLSLAGWLSTSAGLARWRQIVRALVALLGLWCLALSFSRTAWGAFAGGLVVLAVLWLRPRARRTVLIPSRRMLTLVAVGGAVLIAVFGLSYGKYILARTGTEGDTTELRSISDRRYYTGIALQAIAEHPTLGIGIGAFRAFAGDVIKDSPYNGWLYGDYVHNVPLLVFSELGLIGFVIWLVTWSIGLWFAWRRVYDPFAMGLVAGIAALLATGLLDHYIWSMVHFALITWGGLAVALSSAQENAIPSDRIDAPAQQNAK
jgi:O-antigen ligase